ncbi:MAG: CDP-alcohol phosphatidyltransferase family protein [Erysipelotrichia bacterium]|nr:CDP-alcohol phosphatidyltransferase family protein [Erysipelotrichia bacterium]
MRICLIPIFIWLYCFQEDFIMSGVVIVIASMMDVLDGYIARKFNMVTKLGKVLDPVADKLTQVSFVGCLSVRFISMRVLLSIQIIKELILLLFYLFTKKTSVKSAQWYGKACTFVLFVVTIVHVIFPFLSAPISWALSMTGVAFALLSFVMYFRFIATIE